MKSVLLTLSFLLCCVTFLLGQVKKDTIFFRNGTKVIGKLKKIKMGVVTFDPDDANDITVQQRKLSAMNANREFYRIETINKQVLYGIITPDSTLGFVKVTNDSSVQFIHLEEISSLYPFSGKFSQNFSGTVGLGYNYTKSSGFGRFNFDATINYYSKKHELATAFTGIYSQTDTGFTRDREEISIKDNYYFSPAWFVTVFFVYQKNLELGLDRRYQEGIGIGNKFVTSKVMYGWARVGAVLNQEKNIEGVSSKTLAEGYAQLQFNLFKFSKPEIKFDFRQTVYFGITESDRIRTDGQIDLSWELVKDFKLTLQFYNNYDSKPPSVGVSNFDYGIVFGLRYNFF